MPKRASYILIVLLLLAALCPPFIVADSGQITEVTARIPCFYCFTLPSSATIPFMDCVCSIGYFEIDDLLLQDNETLQIEVETGPLQQVGVPTNVLPYTIDFPHPEYIDQSNIGDRYEIDVLIEESDFRAAHSGIYRGTLTFSVRTSTTNEALIVSTTDIEVNAEFDAPLLPTVEPTIQPTVQPTVQPTIEPPTTTTILCPLSARATAPG